jgi:hypothetical protein
MTELKVSEAPWRSASRGAVAVLRAWAGSRLGLLAIAGIAIVAGLAFNWSWLVAAGVAPLIVGVLPCVAMCALGFCMMGMGDRSAKQPSPGGAPSTFQPDLNGPLQLAASSENLDGSRAGADHSAGAPANRSATAAEPSSRDKVKGLF